MLHQLVFLALSLAVAQAELSLTFHVLDQDVVSGHVLNQCPQPSAANPDPPAFLYAHPDNCSFYFSCMRGQPVLRQCKPVHKTRFSEYFHTCVGVNSAFDTCSRSHAQRECRTGATGLIGHPLHCHRFFDCSNPSTTPYTGLGEFESECTYPDLFDVHEGRCKPFKQVTCGPHRVPAKDPCDYAGNHVCKGDNCSPCSARLPSCVGLADGFHVFPGREWTPSYIRCESERLAGVLACAKDDKKRVVKVFSPLQKKCIIR